MNLAASVQFRDWLHESRTLREQLDTSHDGYVDGASETFREVFGYELGQARTELEAHVAAAQRAEGAQNRDRLEQVRGFLCELDWDSATALVNRIDQQIPFVGAFAAFLNSSLRRLREASSSSDQVRLSPALEISLCDHLAVELSQASAKCLFVALNEFRDSHGCRDAYRAFIVHLHRSGFNMLFERFPVLGRRLGTICMTWVDATARMLRRFASDRRSLLGEMLGQAPGEAVELKSIQMAGDRHHGERVTILTLSSGQRVVYKPRSLRVDLQWNRLLASIDACNTAPMFKTAATLDRGAYGWQEYVEYQECADREEAILCFERFGSLLAALHAMRSIDVSCDNIVISDGFPVFIDAETVLHPSLPPNGLRGEPSAAARVGDRFLESVIRTGALPNSFLVDGTEVRDHSALGFTTTRRQRAMREFVHVNSDQMAIEMVESVSRPGHNVVRVRGQAVSPSDHQEAICRGFAAGCQAIRSRAPWLLSPRGIRDLFEGTKSRVLFRDTETYARSLSNATNPQNLMSGVAYSCVFEPLSLPFLLAGGLTSKAGLMAAEQRQLEAGDVPVFATSVSDQHLRDRDQVVVGDMFEESALDAANHRIGGMTQPEIDYQLRVICGTLDAADNRYQVLADTTEGTQRRPASFLRATGQQIVRQLAQAAIASESGAANFLSVQPHPGGQASRFGLLNESLYEGRLGVALIAAMYLSQDRSLESLIDALIRDVQTTLMSGWSREAMCLAEKPAGHNGLGGILYCLLRIGTIADRPELVELVLKACAAIKPERIRASRDLDLFGGIAGMLLALLAIYREAREPAVRALLHQLGERLKASGRRVAPQGFAHGAAGIGFALLRLGQTLDDQSTTSAGLAALQSVWPVAEQLADAHRRGDPIDGSVCNGLAGLTIPAIADAACEHRLEAAAYSRQLCAKPYGHATLCCGQAGICDVAILFGEDPAAGELGLRLAELSETARRACADWPRNGDVGAFKGLSGIAYVLARATRSDLPSILIFE